MDWKTIAAFGLLAVVVSACGGDNDRGTDSGSDVDHDVTEDATGDTDEDLGPALDADDGGGDVPPDAADAPDEAEATDDAVDAEDGSDAELEGDEPTSTTRILDDRPAWVEPPTCGSGDSTWTGLLAGPTDDAWLAELGAKARRHDRLFHALTSHGTGVNADVIVPLDATEARAAIASFLEEDDGWDFEGFTGLAPTDVVSRFEKTAGAYAGVGIAADAFRYATLRDQGADCDDIAVARERVILGLDALHLAVAITGVEGVVARGFALRTLPGAGSTPTVPLFDDEGVALPYEKDNGTWREDNSGLYPDYIWEDSCSRDMLIGWVIGFAAAWEAIGLDPTFDDDLKTRLQSDAAAIARSLLEVSESGFDLEIQDADGRPTFHAPMNENAIDRAYVSGIRNGFHAIMGTGIIAALAFVTEDEAIEARLYDHLIDERGLLEIAAESMIFIDIGAASNFSAYNMAFQGGLLASRYLRDPVARRRAADAVAQGLYARPGGSRQPEEQAQSFFDFVFVSATAGASAFGPTPGPIDDEALARGVETLQVYEDAPYWDVAVENCDEDEIASGECVGLDGTPIRSLGYVGRNGALVAEAPVPMRIRPPSNYHWRTNPYQPNGGGDGSRLLPSVDFRFAYWLGRWTRR